MGTWREPLYVSSLQSLILLMLFINSPPASRLRQKEERSSSPPYIAAGGDAHHRPLIFQWNWSPNIWPKTADQRRRCSQTGLASDIQISSRIFSTMLFIWLCLLVALSGIYHSPSVPSCLQRPLSSGLTPDIAHHCDVGNQILKSNLPISQTPLEGETSWSRRSCQVHGACFSGYLGPVQIFLK